MTEYVLKNIFLKLIPLIDFITNICCFFFVNKTIVTKIMRFFFMVWFEYSTEMYLHNIRPNTE